MKKHIMRQMFIVFVLLSTLACSQKTEKVNSTIFQEGIKLGEVTHPKLREISGIVESAKNPGLFWVHNDSGNAAEIYLVDKDMNLKLTCKLKDVVNRDWEDIAVGPGPEPGKYYVYVADIGDNLTIFQYKNIYRFEEPLLDESTQEIIISDIDNITFQLAGAKRDSESLMVDPRTGDIYIISKREEPEVVYQLKFPHSSKDTLTARPVTTVPLFKVVAADFSPDGEEIMIKTYKNVYYWKVSGRPLEEVLKDKPVVVAYREEPQGEALTFARDGSGFFTVSETNKNQRTYLYFYARTKSE